MVAIAQLVIVPLSLLADIFPLLFSKPLIPFVGMVTHFVVSVVLSSRASRQVAKGHALVSALIISHVGTTLFCVGISIGYYQTHGFEPQGMEMFLFLGAVAVTLSLATAYITSSLTSSPTR
jgi:hypothetical protein